VREDVLMNILVSLDTIGPMVSEKITRGSVG
jgi:hypothetical protein